MTSTDLILPQRQPKTTENVIMRKRCVMFTFY